MQFDRASLIKMYKCMLTIRLFEEAAEYYYQEGYVVGTGHLSFGEEAVAVGACFALKEDDYIVSNHRGHGHVIAKGASLHVVMAELFAKATGCSGGRGGSMHLFDIDHGVLGTNGIVGAGIALAGGVGLALKKQKSDRVCLCFFGDGASNRGVFHEALNLASLWKVPTVFVCSNNQYAISMQQRKACANQDISARAVAYGIPGLRVDGTDILTVFEAVKNAVDTAREGSGPSLIECVAYRLHDHNVRMDLVPGGSDYRPKGEVESWVKNKDPIKIFKAKLMKLGHLTDELANEIQADVKNQIDEAVDFATKSPEPKGEVLFQDIYKQ